MGDGLRKFGNLERESTAQGTVFGSSETPVVQALRHSLDGWVRSAPILTTSSAISAASACHSADRPVAARRSSDTVDGAIPSAIAMTHCCPPRRFVHTWTARQRASGTGRDRDRETIWSRSIRRRRHAASITSPGVQLATRRSGAAAGTNRECAAIPSELIVGVVSRACVPDLRRASARISAESWADHQASFASRECDSTNASNAHRARRSRPKPARSSARSTRSQRGVARARRKY